MLSLTHSSLSSFSLSSLSFLAAVALTGVVGCSSASSADAPVAGHQVAKSGLDRDTSPTLTDAEKTALATDQQALTAELFAKIRVAPGVEGGNVAFSPLSISAALAMPYAGAKGATASEMKSTLHYSLAADRQAKAYDWLTLELAKREGQALASANAKAKAAGSDGVAPDPANFRLHVVNSIWADALVKFQAPFLDTMARDYGAGVTLANFVASADTERLAINGWVSDETQTKIRDLLPAGSLDSSTRLVLVDALHLKFPWATPLTVAKAPAPFTRADGTKVDATFVGTTSSYSYYEDDAVQVVGVPLEGGNEVMWFASPKKDLAAFEAGLDGATLAKIHAGAKAVQVDFSAPKFRFDTASIKLADALQSLGMKTPFIGGAADFSGIGQADGPLFISEVFHKAMIGVDEKGVEAAAATAVVMSAGSAPDPEKIKVVHLDKPFFFAITDEPTNAVLFAGHVVDPTK